MPSILPFNFKLENKENRGSGDLILYVFNQVQMAPCVVARHSFADMNTFCLHSYLTLNNNKVQNLYSVDEFSHLPNFCLKKKTNLT